MAFSISVNPPDPKFMSDMFHKRPVPQPTLNYIASLCHLYRKYTNNYEKSDCPSPGALNRPTTHNCIYYNKLHCRY